MHIALSLREQISADIEMMSSSSVTTDRRLRKAELTTASQIAEFRNSFEEGAITKHPN